jgi:hypothetical protein
MAQRGDGIYFRGKTWWLDTHHVMVAIKRECAAFVTCDEAAILKYRTQVEAEFPIRLMLLSELIERDPDAGDPGGPKGK